MEPVDKIVELRRQITQISHEHWINDTQFTLKWWLMVLAVVVIWFVWWKLLDKKRFNEIGLIGFITAVLNFVLNSFGIENCLWAYPDQILGVVRTWSILELSFMSVSIMLLNQYFKEWRKYLIAVIIFGAIGSFIAQPVFIYFDKFKLYNWRNLYSFPIYIFIGILVKFVALKILDIQKHAVEHK
jgi:MFS superfamily sulfate permease-like transporter